MGMTSTPAAELRGVSVRAGNRFRLQLTDLRIRAGAVTAVIGRNGSGKSTLLGVLSGELAPSTGRAFVDGHDVHELSTLELARRRALLTQETQVSFGFTVADVVGWGRTAWRGSPLAADDAAAVDDAITAQALDDLRDRPVTSLSGGERKRVHIARVMAQDTGLLLLDEADSDLDLLGRRSLDALVAGQAAGGRAAVVVTHDVTRISHLCDDVVLMRAGHVHAHGPRGEVLTEALLSEAFGVPVRVVGDGDDMIIRIA
jgi:iron complex transport system ATP-binding protein